MHSKKLDSEPKIRFLVKRNQGNRSMIVNKDDEEVKYLKGRSKKILISIKSEL